MKAKILTILLLGSAVCLQLGFSATPDVEGPRLNIGYNTVDGSGTASIGDNNNYSTASAWGILQVGGNNDVSGGEVAYSLVAGESNNSMNLIASAVFGYYNNAQASVSLVAGENNYVIGSYAMILGKGLIYEDWSSNAKMIVGQYNEEIANPLFVVGNGTHSTNDRKNALEVLQDGTVRIPKRQGDVGMGRFGYTADQ